MEEKRDVSTRSDEQLDRDIANAKPIPKDKKNGKQADRTPLDSAERAETAPAHGLPPTFADLRPAAMERMEARRRGDERPVPVPWPKLAQQLGGGLWPGVYVLVGNTGTGRSQLALQMALAAVRKGVPAAYVGLELDELQLVARVNSLAAYEEGNPVHWSNTYLGEVEAPELKEEWSKWPLHLGTAGPYGWDAGTELPALGAAMRAAYPEERPGARPFLVVVDFLQIVDGKDGLDRKLDLRERIGRASYAARAVARDLNAAVLLVSSTARDNYKFDAPKRDPDRGDQFGVVNPRSLIGLGKESGEIEYAADCVLVLGHTGSESVSSDKDGNVRPNTPLALGIAKARARSSRADSPYVHLRFDGSYFREAPTPKYAGKAVGPAKAPSKSKAGEDDDIL